MSKQTVYLAVDFTINEGKLAAFESIAQEMVAGSGKEAGTLGYEWFLSADRNRLYRGEGQARARSGRG